MKGNDQFSSAKGRLTRAKQHIRAVDAGCKRFINDKPYVRVVEPHTDGISEAHKIKLRRKVPKVITDRAYEAFDALRSSLDQAAYAVAAACGVTRLDRIQFPITDDPAEFENTVRGRLKDCTPDVLSIFRSFQAYPGGNDCLVALNRVRRQGFHRLLVPVVNASAGISTGANGFGALRAGPIWPAYIPVPEWDSEKDEMIFGVIGPGGEFQYNFKFAFFIAFGEIEGLAGEPVIPALKGIATEVERIILGIESQAKRLGLLN